MSETVQILHGDVRERLPELADSSVHSIVTDPPYEIGFMGKSWDASSIAYDVAMWRDAYRVLKPGGYLLAFSSARTYHRMACAIEDAGFEIRDQLMWIYGQGFPKSLDVAKAIDKAAGAEREVIERGKAVKRMIPGADQDKTGSWIKDNGRKFVPTVTEPATDEAKQWEGWGTALKPAHEPICVARKPLIGTVTANVLAHGTGALNIDACRVDGPKGSGVWGSSNKTVDRERTFVGSPDASEYRSEQHKAGRWPSNVILDEEAAEILDEQTGVLTSGANPNARTSDKTSGIYGKFKGEQALEPFRGADFGGASRFFYCPKATQAERAGGNHPTVKPLALMRYLVRLVTPSGGLVLDLFAGSGTTGSAALAEGMSCVLIERDAAYIELIRGKLERTTLGFNFEGEA